MIKEFLKRIYEDLAIFLLLMFIGIYILMMFDFTLAYFFNEPLPASKFILLGGFSNE